MRDHGADSEASFRCSGHRTCWRPPSRPMLSKHRACRAYPRSAATVSHRALVSHPTVIPLPAMPGGERAEKDAATPAHFGTVSCTHRTFSVRTVKPRTHNASCTPRRRRRGRRCVPPRQSPRVWSKSRNAAAPSSSPRSATSPSASRRADVSDFAAASKTVACAESGRGAVLVRPSGRLLLILDAALDDIQWSAADGGDGPRRGPQRWQRMQPWTLLAQSPRASVLQPHECGSGTAGGISTSRSTWSGITSKPSNRPIELGDDLQMIACSRSATSTTALRANQMTWYSPSTPVLRAGNGSGSPLNARSAARQAGDPVTHDCLRAGHRRSSAIFVSCALNAMISRAARRASPARSRDSNDCR